MGAKGHWVKPPTIWGKNKQPPQNWGQILVIDKKKQHRNKKEPKYFISMWRLRFREYHQGRPVMI
jgi:hypothetical protein